VIQGHREPLTELKTHPDEPGLCPQRVLNRLMHLLGSQVDAVQVVATSSPAVLYLYLPQPPKPNWGPDKDVVFLELVVHIPCPVLGSPKHQDLGEEVVSTQQLAHCLLLYQRSLKVLLQVVSEDLPQWVFRNLFPTSQVFNKSASEEGVVSFRRVLHTVPRNQEILRRWS
jgi:hypothetical protein